jgi:hypothetical protein
MRTLPSSNNMKISILLGAAVAVLGTAAASALGQAQSTTSYIETSKLVGVKVKSSQGEEVGVVKDVVLDRNTGCMAYTVLSTGGTGEAKLVAVPWGVYTESSDPSFLTVRVDRERIYNAPVFEYSRINEYSTSGFVENLSSYYGVTSQTGFGGQTSLRGRAGTAEGEARTTTSPVESAQPTAGRTESTGAASRTSAASPRVTASPTMSAGTRATASPRATRGTQPEESTAGRSKASATPRERNEKTAASPSEESTSEGAASPSKEKSRSSRRHTTEEGAQPTATPQD